jgi:hypothetical protein
MQPEVEKLLNEMRENKRKNDELNILNEKIRKDEVYKFIQTNKAMWEAQERFHEENGNVIRYSDMTCPTCNKIVRLRANLCIKCDSYDIGTPCCIKCNFPNIGKPKCECQSCVEILKSRNDLYVIRCQSK